MEESDVIRKVKTGDFAAFEDWMGNHYRNIERFVFQNGCTQEQAAEIAEAAFRGIYNDLENFDDQICNVYKIVLEKIANLQPSASLLEDVFRFEEDAELHSELIKLEAIYRVPLILRLFHEFDDVQIARITNRTISDVGARIQAAKEYISKAIEEPSVERLEKRLELLGKSYDRLPVFFNAKNVLKTTADFERIPAVEERKKFSRKGWTITAVLVVILIGLVARTYFTGEEWELRSDRKYIEQLKKEFAKKVEEKKAILGGSNEVYNRIPFIADANEQFESMLLALENRISNGREIDRQLVSDGMFEIYEMMKLPSELADDLFAAPLVDDAEQSMNFATGYLEKAYEIKYSLYELYADDYDKFRESIKTGTFDTKAILAQQDEYSESTIEAIKTIISQNIGLVWREEALERNINSEFIGQLRAALHESAGSYLTQYEKEPFIMNEKLLYSLDETIGFIEEMEATLVAERQNQWFGDSGPMHHLLDMILQGKTIEEFKNSDGSISEVHRNAWKQLASFGPDSGVGVIMAKVVEEMEASDWKHSELHSSLDDWRIYEAYSFAIEGKLDQYGMKPPNEMYDDLTFILPNSQLDEVVADLYSEFSVSYDRSVLKTSHPLLIVGLFYYANDKGDTVMMWHLMDPASRVASLEGYNVKEIALLDVTDSIRFNPSLIMGDGGQKTVPIEFERNGKMYYNIWMTYAEDQVWQVESIVIEEGSL